MSDLVINTSVNFTPFKFIGIDFRYQYERQQTNGRFLRDEHSFYTRNLFNRFTQIDDDQVTRNIPAGGILDLSNHVMESHQFRGQLNVSHSWNEHDIHVIVGSEIRDANSVSDRFRTYGYNSDILTFGNVDYLTRYPDFVTGNLSFVPQFTGFDDLTTRFVSAYANGSYALKNRYIFSGSARRDASNLFGLNTNDKWNLLWSVGASWELSKEPFYRFTSFPYLRLRTTYGFSGNIDPSMSALTTIRYVAISPNTPGAPYARPNNYSNPDLKWETTGMFNIGVDFTAFGGKLRGNLEYYQKRGKDLFGVAEMDVTAGIGNTIDKNVATMKAMGFDAGLTSVNIDRRFFSWQTTFNLSYNRDEIVDYYLSDMKGSRFVTGTVVSGVKGRPVYALYSYRWAGLDPETGDPRGLLNGEVSNEYTRLRGAETQIGDLQYHGPTLPIWFGSLGNRFELGNFSIDFWLTYKLGHFFRRNSIDYGALFARGIGHSDFSSRWQNPGDENTTDIPSMVYPNPTSFRDEFYLRSEVTAERGDHIRLNYVNVAYELENPTIVRRLGVKSLTLYANCSNLGLIWRANSYEIDPEITGGSSTPTAAVYAIGLRVNFN